MSRKTDMFRAAGQGIKDRNMHELRAAGNRIFGRAYLEQAAIQVPMGRVEGQTWSKQGQDA